MSSGDTGLVPSTSDGVRGQRALDAHAGGQRRQVLRVDVHDELGEVGVDRAGGGLDHVHLPVRGVVVVARLPVLAGVGLGDGDLRRRVVGRLQADALLERLGHRERLEGGAGRPARATVSGGQVHLQRAVVAAAVHGPHVALGVERDERRLGIGVAPERRLHRVDRVGLHAVVERRVDAQATAVDLGRGEVARRGQPLVDVVDEVLGTEVGVGDRAVVLDLLAGQHIGERVGHGRVVLLLGDVALGQHGVEHRGPPPDRRLEVGPGQGVGLGPLGVGQLRGPDQRGQVRGLGQRQVADVLAEVGLRRGLHPVGAASEVDRVEVAVQDLGLGQLPLELHREDRLLDLPGDRALVGEVDVLHVLLRDRRAALLRAAAAQVGPEGPGDADRVDAAVLEEGAVLGAEHGVDQHRRDLVVGDGDAVLAAAELGHRVVCVAAAGDVGRAEERGLQEGWVFGRQRHLAEEVADPGDPEHDQQPHEEEDPAPAPEEPGALAGCLVRLSPGLLGGPPSATDHPPVPAVRPNVRGSTRRCGRGGSRSTRGRLRRRSRRTRRIVWRAFGARPST